MVLGREMSRMRVAQEIIQEEQTVPNSALELGQMTESGIERLMIVPLISEGERFDRAK